MISKTESSLEEYKGDKSWGYNPALYFSPEAKYGSPDDLKCLINKAHCQGLAVIFDVVYTHLLWGKNEGNDSSLNPFKNFNLCLLRILTTPIIYLVQYL